MVTPTLPASPSLLSVGRLILFSLMLAPQEVINNALQKLPGFFVLSYVVLLADIGVVIFPHEDQGMWPCEFYSCLKASSTLYSWSGGLQQISTTMPPMLLCSLILTFIYVRCWITNLWKVCVFWVGKCCKLHCKSVHRYVSVILVWLSGFAISASNYWAWEERDGRCVISAKLEEEPEQRDAYESRHLFKQKLSGFSFAKIFINI